MKRHVLIAFKVLLSDRKILSTVSLQNRLHENTQTKQKDGKKEKERKPSCISVS